MNIQLADLLLHIDENLSPEQRGTIEESLRALDGVVSVSNRDRTPHLTLVQFNPDEVSSQDILTRITNQGAHAQVAGL
jgi:hypothetical protein